MKIQFKNQDFQIEATRAVVRVFEGQPYLKPTYLMDKGIIGENVQLKIGEDDATAWNNAKIVPELTDEIILKNINDLQIKGGIEPSTKVERETERHDYNLTIEMETGIGKTFTYIKTMFELNKNYGWSKFIIVVPSIAIREGVYKSFQMTEDFFKQEYGKTARYFIYKSSDLTSIDRFAQDSSINVMIINSQAFNASGEDANRIYRKLDSFRSRRPIDVIAKTNPILIIDEPQSVEGVRTKEKLKEFNALFTLRYSATHRKDLIYNMIYRLDAIDAFNQKLVKKIYVIGIEESGTKATNSYVYLQSINISKDYPTATIEIDYKGKSGTSKRIVNVKEKTNLYTISGELQEYKNNWVVKNIDARDGGTIEFLNGVILYVGDVVGKIEEEQLRRLQIRETIKAHINKEKALFKRGIKVLSLFFIDKVEHYRKYGKSDEEEKGLFATIFEEEYANIVKEYIRNVIDEVKTKGLDEKEHPDYEYVMYLKDIGEASKTHNGYFSKDKKGHLIDSKEKRGEGGSDDIDAYTLIMKDKERLLDRNPKKSPWRFIFSHSALKEGWDNTNVFQICTLKESDANIRRRQEVGRGLRLCVNENGERQDEQVLGKAVHDVNELTIIASESYETFAKGLQTEIAEAVADRASLADTEYFIGKTIIKNDGTKEVISEKLANKIHFSLIQNFYVDSDEKLTNDYFSAKEGKELRFNSDVADYSDGIVKLLDSLYRPVDIANGRHNVKLVLDNKKVASKEFKELWDRINGKSVYTVSFDSDELIDKSIKSINEHLNVAKIYFKIVKGAQVNKISKRKVSEGTAFKETNIEAVDENTIKSTLNVKYDLVGKVAKETFLTRKDVVCILSKINKEKFDMFKNNPEEFIIKVSRIINDEKATAIIEHIVYNKIDETYGMDIFTENNVKGIFDKNCMKTNKHIYDNLIYDSDNERKFADKIDKDANVELYIKLPDGFYINTPVGKYNPDWAISYKEGDKKHIYFVAETKGNMDSLDMTLRGVEKAKVICAKEHFRAISGDKVIYDVIDGYDGLLKLIKK